MGEAHHAQLDVLFADLARIAGQVRTVVRDASRALLTGDGAIAETVIAEDKLIDRATEELEEAAFLLLSAQQPPAGDLRTVVAALRVVGELGQMGDLSVRVAKIARLRVPEVAVPPEARATMLRTATVTEEMVGRVARIIGDRDPLGAQDVRLMEDELDQLRVSMFTHLLVNEWRHDVESAVDIALVGRYYERIADHAVSIARRVVVLEPGESPAGA